MSVIAPDQLVGARSPIYLTANYSALATSITDITLEIYVWNGSRSSRPSTADYTLFRDVFAGTDVSFDIAPMVREEIGAVYDTNQTRTSPTGEKNNNIVWVQVDYDINYLNKADPPVTVNVTGSTDIFPASNGYHIFSEGANFEFPSAYLNNTSTVYVEDNGYEMMPLFMGKYNNEVIENVIYRIGGATTHQFDITGYGADVQPEDRILRIPIGELSLNNWLTSDGYAGASSDRPINQSEWILELNTAGSVFDTITVIKECEPKYTINTIQYINRYGTWDFIHFYKASQDNFSVTSERFRKSIGTSSSSGFTYDTTDNIYQQFNTNGKVTTTLNTGWVTEDYREAIKDLMMSEKILLNGLPVNVVTNSVTLQKSINDRTINYTIEVEEAYDTRYV
jgi:hypothetical protein